jgi:hypothetical protein
VRYELDLSTATSSQYLAVNVSRLSVDNRLTDGSQLASIANRPPFVSKKIPSIHFCYRLN